MDPRKWKREHQVALAIAAALGAFVGLLVGFPLQTRWSGFGRYAGDLEVSGVPILLGALAGAAVVYAQRLLKA